MSKKRRKGSTNPDVGYSVSIPILPGQSLVTAAIDSLVEYSLGLNSLEPYVFSEEEEAELWEM